MTGGRLAPAASKDQRGETIALLVLWPAMMTAVLLLLVHAFIVSNARAQAEIAASDGLRAAWRVAAVADFDRIDDPDQEGSFVDFEPGSGDAHPRIVDMVDAVQDAVAHAASGSGGWRWYAPNAAEVHSSLCFDGVQADSDGETFVSSDGQAGWTRIVVSGEVVGPLAAIFPSLLDRVYAVASGPAVPTAGSLDDPRRGSRLELPTC